MNHLPRFARAVVFRAPNQVELDEVELGPLAPTDVAVRTMYSWTSPGTELSFLRGERSAGDTPANRDAKPPFPIVPGYQKVGTVIAMGAEVRGFTLGQSVFAALGRVEGMHDAYGGHIAISITPQEQVFALPDNVPPMQFSGLVLTQVGWNCGMRPKVDRDGMAWVVGDGLVGLWTAQTLQSRGARVRLIGRHPDRLARLKLRAGDQVDCLQPSQRVAGLVGDDPSSVVDTVGDIDMVHAMMNRVRVSGDIVCAGFYPANDELNIRAVRARELTIHTPCGWTPDRMRQTRDAIHAGALDTQSMITHSFPVEQARDAYAAAADRTSNALGVILKW